MEKEKRGASPDELQQQQLNFGGVTTPQEFSREGALDAIVKLIATNDQVRDQYTEYGQK
jgi:hypothetical protein